jgi:hypothetical protein
MKKEELNLNQELLTSETKYAEGWNATIYENNFIQECLFNEFSDKLDAVNELLEKAENTEDFYKLILADERMRKTQAYARLSKALPHHWYRIRDMFGDKQFKTYSDVGGLKIGNENFSMIIPNGYGDGTTRVAIFEERYIENEFNDMMLKFFTSVKGKFNIYGYDCGNEVVKTLEGDYNIYYGDGFIAFQRG